jgi:hypothetical protein
MRDVRSGEFADNLTLALNSLRMRPDQGLADMVMQRQEQRAQERQANRTSEWLASIGRTDLAEAVASGFIDARTAAVTAMTPQAAPEGVVVGDALVRPDTGEVIYQPETAPAPGISDEQLSALNAIRDDVRAELGPFDVVRSGYENIVSFYETGGGISDYALVVAFAKILDPGSVVRGEEVQAVNAAGAAFPAYASALRNAFTGEGQLTEQTRREIAELATQVYQQKAGAANETIARYQDLASQAGLPRDFVFFGQVPEARGVNTLVRRSNLQKPVDVPQSTWDGMTEEEKQQAVNIANRVK